MNVIRGSRVKLEDEGEGWFPENVGSSLPATVTQIIADDHERRWYVLTFDEPLELQEKGATTPSGMCVCRYPWGVVRSRWLSPALTGEHTMSSLVSLVREGNVPPVVRADLDNLPIRAWARLSIE
jgi:hypothetical protein